MKNWMRIFLVCFALIGGTVFFVFISLNKINNALDDLSASSIALANIPPVSISNKTNKEQVSTTVQEIISTPTTSADLKASFILPNINKDVYAGCTYQLVFPSKTIVGSMETLLVDAGSKDIIEPTVSGLAKEYKIASNSQRLDWKVGEIWPGEYYIKVSSINGVIRSKVFTISNMPKGASADEKARICKESDGSF